MSSTSTSPSSVPSSILIVGGGVFGLSTALALAKRPAYARTSITLLEPYGPIPTSHVATTSSVDTTRIIRADYADPEYAQLARDAQALWRTEYWGGEGRYNESGLCLTADVGYEAYVFAALENVRQLEREHAEKEHNECSGGNDVIQELSSPEEIAAVLGLGSAACGSGMRGYLNRASGWANAEACMRHLRGVVEASQRVRFVVGEATQLMVENKTSSVNGVQLENGETIAADQTILATGAWTGRLVDLRGIASARAQCIGYMDISEEEAETLKGLPVVYNMGAGVFFFPPTPKTGHGGGWEIKVALHAFGYTNPVEFEAPVGAGDGEQTITTSLPAAHAKGIPPAIKEQLVQCLLRSLPILNQGQKADEQRGLSHSRLCYYLDTQSSDWLVCPYPLSHPSPAAYPSLFLATGGSGHAFKFLPNLGEKVVDVLDGSDQLPEKGAGLWSKKWAWPCQTGNLRAHAEIAGLEGKVQGQNGVVNGEDDGEVWCMDGSRVGEIGMRLAEAYA